MKKILLTISLSTVILLCGCSTNNEAIFKDTETTQTDNITQEPFDMESYKNSIKHFNDSAMDTSVLLSNMAQYENNYWQAIGGKINFDKMLSATYDWLEEKGNTKKEELEKKYNDVCSIYKEISLIEVSDKEAEELQSESKALFTSFNALYNLATNPSGDNSTFVKNYNEYIDSIKSHNSLIEIYLK